MKRADSPYERQQHNVIVPHENDSGHRRQHHLQNQCKYYHHQAIAISPLPGIGLARCTVPASARRGSRLTLGRPVSLPALGDKVRVIIITTTIITTPFIFVIISIIT